MKLFKQDFEMVMFETLAFSAIGCFIMVFAELSGVQENLFIILK